MSRGCGLAEQILTKLSRSFGGAACGVELELGATRDTDKLAYAGMILIKLMTMGASEGEVVFPMIDDNKKSVKETSLLKNPCMIDDRGQYLSGCSWLLMPQPLQVLMLVRPDCCC